MQSKISRLCLLLAVSWLFIISASALAEDVLFQKDLTGATHQKTAVDPPEPVETCLLSKAKTLAKDKYLECESLILRGFSGSGGYFLTTAAMDWIREGRSALKGRGVKLPDDARIHSVFGNSYYNAENYEKALEEFRLARDGYGQQTAQWMILNAAVASSGGKVTPVKALQDPTKTDTTRTCDLKAGNVRYLGFFKGGVYSYEKGLGTLLYLPPNEYDWPVDLKLDGSVLTAKLRNDDVVKYNIDSNDFTRGAGY